MTDPKPQAGTRTRGAPARGIAPGATASRNLETLRSIAERVTLPREGTLRLDGEDVAVDGNEPAPRYADTPAFVPVIPDGYPAAVRSLAQALYEKVYDKPGALYLNNRDKLRDEAFVRVLREAHASRWSWIAGFDLAGEEPGQVRLKATYWAEFPAARETVQGPDAAGKCRLRRDPVNEAIQPNYIHLAGEEGIPAAWPPCSRVYWNVGPEGARSLVATVTATLNRAGIPFNFKILNNPRSMVRPDAAVLYFPTSEMPRAERPLADVHAAVRLHLRSPTPAFTRRLAPGVAYAEDPGNTLSFGEDRSQRVAVLLWDAFQAGLREPGDLLGALVRGLGSRGYPLERLHLNPGSAADIGITLAPPWLPLEEFADA